MNGTINLTSSAKEFFASVKCAVTRAIVTIAALTMTVAGAQAQDSLPLNNDIATTYRNYAVATDKDVRTEYNNSWRTEQTKALLTFAKPLGFSGEVDPRSGLIVRSDIDHSKGSILATLRVRTVIVPLVGHGSKGESAALLIEWTQATPGLAVYRLVVRQTAGNVTFKEYSYDVNKTVVELKDSDYRPLVSSSLRLIAKKNPAACDSIKATLTSTASKSVGASLCAIFDPRNKQTGFAAKELALASDAFAEMALETDYPANQVSTLIDQAPELNKDVSSSQSVSVGRGVAPHTAHEAVKQILHAVVKSLGALILSWLKGWFGF